MKKYREGFTIIEVVLVLAVAGLIFLVAFSILPALQISSRDTQRRESISTLISNIKDYQTNNRGSLPSGTGSVSGDAISASAAENTWMGFYRDYLGDKYWDPLGYKFNLMIAPCDARSVDSKCEAEVVKNIEDQFFSERNYTIVIVTGATCSGSTAVGTASPRKVAAVYKLEGAGTYCQGT